MNAAYADEAAGIIKSIKGEVSIVRDGAPIKAWAGMKLMAADKIVTGAGSVSAQIIQVLGRGELEPLVMTADGVAEPRNRRVEVTVC